VEQSDPARLCPACESRIDQQRFCPACGYDSETAVGLVGPFTFTSPRVKSVFKKRRVTTVGAILIVLTLTVLYVTAIRFTVGEFLYGTVKNKINFVEATHQPGDKLHEWNHILSDAAASGVILILTSAVSGFVIYRIGLLGKSNAVWLPVVAATMLSLLIAVGPFGDWYIQQRGLFASLLVLSAPMFSGVAAFSGCGIGLVHASCQVCGAVMRDRHSRIPIRQQELLQSLLQSEEFERVKSLETVDEQFNYCWMHLWWCDACGYSAIDGGVTQTRKRSDRYDERSEVFFSKEIPKSTAKILQ